MCYICSLTILKLIAKGKVSEVEVAQANKDVRVEIIAAKDEMLKHFTMDEIKAIAAGNYKPTIH